MDQHEREPSRSKRARSVHSSNGMTGLITYTSHIAKISLKARISIFGKMIDNTIGINQVKELIVIFTAENIV